MRAFVCGLSGPVLTADERRFLADAQPWGVILFARNTQERAAVARLTADIREALGRADAPVFVDQEGGRVQRLRPPNAERHPPAAAYGALWQRDPAQAAEAVRLGARLLAEELREVGITVDCLPVLDLTLPGAHQIIGDRSYGADPAMVATLGRAAAEGLLAGGVLPVFKHVPGHGRAVVDSHEALPVVDTDRAALERTDFAPFQALADLPAGMTAHVVYTAIDADRPATTSATIIAQIIRGHMGFSGLLVTDDLGMSALKGSLIDRARGALEAGCDIALSCNAPLAEQVKLAAAMPELSGESLARAERALARLAPPQPFDREAAVALVRGLVPPAAA